MKNSEAILHVKGESLFVDDIPLQHGTLYADLFVSPITSGEITHIDISSATNVDGVMAVLLANDIPGKNQIGNIIEDEPLLVDQKIHFIGQPIAVVVGNSPETARQGLNAIHIEYEKTEAVFDPRIAFSAGKLISPPRTFSIGDTEKTWAKCDIIVEGQCETGAQEHVYLETQAAYAIPKENGGLKIYSATQAASGVQKIIAHVLNVPMNKIEVDVPRLGGAFGGKEDQATAWACMVALASFTLKRPVKICLTRCQDMCWTGKRHPYSSDFKMGLTKEGLILAYEVTFYQNAGAHADLSPAILERTLFHTTNTYFVPNVKATGVSCRTSLPPNTAFRGFGAPQAMFVFEAALYKAANRLGKKVRELQKMNLLQDNKVLPYGMIVKNSRAKKCWNRLVKEYDIHKIEKRIQKFNQVNPFVKKGIAIMPVCFGISFTSTFLNQASSLVHVYLDGSVGISTAAVEMGQGVKNKIKKVAGQTLGIHDERIRIESTNTVRIANMSPTAASTGADLNGQATKMACLMIVDRLSRLAHTLLNAQKADSISLKDEKIYLNENQTEISWENLVNSAYFARISLSAQAFYATPHIFFDKKVEKGKPFAYFVYGASITEVTLNCLRGNYYINSVKVIHDAGTSLDPLIDRGQIEGGIVQGIGWNTCEEIIHGHDGQLLSKDLTTYKIPDVYFAPHDIQIKFLDIPNTLGLYSSKAIGEPPFLYGIGAYFALLNAMKAFRPELNMEFSSPKTPEKVLLALYE